jgi:hypothetical protein
VLRDTLIHTLGNLTLIRYRLNAALANLPWTDAEASACGLGPVGKRTELSNHSLLKINAELVAANPRAWTEQAITARTAELANSALAVWPRPPAPAVDLTPAEPTAFEAAALAATAGVSPSKLAPPAGSDGAAERDDDEPDEDADPADDALSDEDGAEGAEGGDDADGPESDVDGTGPRGKYARLIAFLRQQHADTLAMTFEQVEDVLGDPLPPSARTSIPYWSRRKAALAAAIGAGGYRPSNVDLWNERVIFARAAARAELPVRRRPPGRRRRPPPTG